LQEWASVIVRGCWRSGPHTLAQFWLGTHGGRKRGLSMCQRQIDRRSTPPKPCNDNQPRTITRLTPRRPIAYRTGILAAVLERTERVRLDVLAAGVVTIQGQRSKA
jgi:hypothetical protein